MSRRRLLGAVVAMGAFGVAGPAHALDCEAGGCLDVTTLPGGAVDWADLVRQGQRFFGISTRVFIVSSSAARVSIPYMQRALGPIREQVHIPDIYHASTEARFAGAPHFIWHYIVGHEFAHVYQDQLQLIEALRAPYANRSHVAFELHADFLAGFFLASEYGLQIEAIDQILGELGALPQGAPSDVGYHGEPHQRFFMATQGALLALQRPRPSLAEASAEGVRRLGDVLPS